MKSASPALTALLATRRFLVIDLYTLTLSNGQSQYFSAGDADVLWNGNRYACGGLTGPFWGQDGSRAMLHQKLGTDVDTFYVSVIPGQSLIKGVTWGEARRIGVFQGAWLQYSRAYFALPLTATTWPLVPVGVLPRFYGMIGAIDGGGANMAISVNSPLKILQRSLPRNLYQPTCLNCLGDEGCGVDWGALMVRATVQPGSNALSIVTASLSQGAGYYDHGIVFFDSGVLQGYSRTIESWIPNTINLATPFFAAPAAGDNFTIAPGCDKTFGPQGCPKYGNQANFRGHPYVPPPATGQP